MLKNLKINRTLILIIAGGLTLRLIGIAHGFPFIFHPDEPAVVRSAIGIRFDPNPAHFDWPHLHFYLNFILHWIFIKFRGALQILGLRDSLSSIFPILWRDPLIFYLLSRIFDAVLGALTAVPLFLAGKNLFNKKVGLFAALTLMVLPFHAHASHFALVDIPMAFWVVWAFYFATNIYLKRELKDYILAGFFVGLAASTKYNGGLWALLIPTAHFLRTRKVDIKKFGLSAVAAVAAFILGTPYSVLDFDTFTILDSPKGALWQFENVGKVDFMTNIFQFADSLTLEFAVDFGYFPIFVYTAFVIYTIISRKNKTVWFVLLPSVLIFFYIASFKKLRAHYFLSLYPFVALIFGYVLNMVTQGMKKFPKYLIFIIAFLVPLAFSFNATAELHKKDTRVLLYEWMQENVSNEDYILYDGKDLEVILEKFSDNKTLTYPPTSDVYEQSGYLLISLDDDAKDVSEGFEKVRVFTANKRRGPDIAVYEFGKD